MMCGSGTTKHSVNTCFTQTLTLVGSLDMLWVGLRHSTKAIGLWNSFGFGRAICSIPTWIRGTPRVALWALTDTGRTNRLLTERTECSYHEKVIFYSFAYLTAILFRLLTDAVITSTGNLKFISTFTVHCILHLQNKIHNDNFINIKGNDLMSHIFQYLPDIHHVWNSIFHLILSKCHWLKKRYHKWTDIKHQFVI